MISDCLYQGGTIAAEHKNTAETWIGQVLHQVASQVLEEFCFLLPVSTPESTSAGGESTVTVDFRGMCNGTLVVTASKSLMSPLTMNMLGEEEDPSLEQQQDALKEVANIICGNLLPIVCQTAEAVFYLEAPELVDGPEVISVCPDDLTVRSQVHFDEGLTDFLLHINNPGTGVSA